LEPDPGYSGWNAFQDCCAGKSNPIIPEGLNIRFVIVKDTADTLLFLLEGVYHGTFANFKTAIQPILTALDAVGGLDETLVAEKTVGWLDSLKYANSNALFSNWDNGQTLEIPFNYTAHATFVSVPHFLKDPADNVPQFAKSLMTNELTPAGVDAWITRLYDTGSTNARAWYFIVAAQGCPTSVVPKVPTTKAPTRTAIKSSNGSSSTPSAMVSLQMPKASPGSIPSSLTSKPLRAISRLACIITTTDPTLSPPEAHEHYWLSNYPKLAPIKKQVDPGLLLMNPQTVNT
jgi:hypothetical protein